MIPVLTRATACTALAALVAGSALLAGAVPASAGTSGEIRGYAAKCADDNGGSVAPRTRIQVWDCTGGAPQQWSFSGGELKRGGMCMNDKASGGTGSPVILWSCTGAPDEAWSHNAGGEYVLKANGLCLDDPAYSTRNGTQLIMYRCNGGANQRWSLPSSPPPAPRTLLNVSGSGDYTTAKFTAPGDWDVDWTYGEGSFGQSVNFVIFGDGGSDFSFNGPNQLGTGGSGVVHVYGDAGTHYLEIISEGDWTVKVVAAP